MTQQFNGQPPAAPVQYGQPPAAPAQYGQPPAAPAQYGQPPAAPAQYGQPPAAPAQYGQPPAAPAQYGQPPAAPSQSGAGGMFAGLSEVTQGYGNSVYPAETGDYLLKIKSLENGYANAKGCDLFVGEFEVVESTVEEHPAGTLLKNLILFENAHMLTMYQRHAKDCLLACYKGVVEDMSFDKLGVQEWLYAVSEQQPFAGKYVRLSTRPAVSKAGKVYTQKMWYAWKGPEDTNTGAAFNDQQPAMPAFNDQQPAMPAQYGQQPSMPAQYEQQPAMPFPTK